MINLLALYIGKGPNLKCTKNRKLDMCEVGLAFMAFLTAIFAIRAYHLFHNRKGESKRKKGQRKGDILKKKIWDSKPERKGRRIGKIRNKKER